MIFGRLARAVNIIAKLLPSLERIEYFIILENNSLESLEGSSTSCIQESTHAQLVESNALKKDHLSMTRETVWENNGVQSGTIDFQLSVSGLWCKLDEPNEHSEKFFLQDVSFVVHENSLTVMTGQVGSGKSTLLAAIAGEVIETSGNYII